MLGLSLYQTHPADLEKPQNPVFSTLLWQIITPTTLIRSVNACFIGPLLHAQCRPIEPAEPGAPIPRLPSLADFERRPRCVATLAMGRRPKSVTQPDLSKRN